jgi:hypothetical protein
MAVLASLPPPFTNVTASSAYVFEPAYAGVLISVSTACRTAADSACPLSGTDRAGRGPCSGPWA